MALPIPVSLTKNATNCNSNHNLEFLLTAFLERERHPDGVYGKPLDIKTPNLNNSLFTKRTPHIQIAHHSEQAYAWVAAQLVRDMIYSARPMSGAALLGS